MALMAATTLDSFLWIIGQGNGYNTVEKGASGVVHAMDNAHMDCQPNDNVEAMRVFLDAAGIEARPVLKPMHKQPIYASAPAYLREYTLYGRPEPSVSEALFKVGMCLPAGPMVTDEDVRYIVGKIREGIVQ